MPNYGGESRSLQPFRSVAADALPRDTGACGSICTACASMTSIHKTDPTAARIFARLTLQISRELLKSRSELEKPADSEIARRIASLTEVQFGNPKGRRRADSVASVFRIAFSGAQTGESISLPDDAFPTSAWSCHSASEKAAPD